MTIFLDNNTYVDKKNTVKQLKLKTVKKKCFKTSFQLFINQQNVAGIRSSWLSRCQCKSIVLTRNTAIFLGNSTILPQRKNGIISNSITYPRHSLLMVWWGRCYYNVCRKDMVYSLQHSGLQCQRGTFQQDMDTLYYDWYQRGSNSRRDTGSPRSLWYCLDSSIPPDIRNTRPVV